MGRGRQKAKQTKIARKLKYLTTDTDYDELAKELSHHDIDGQTDGENVIDTVTVDVIEDDEQQSEVIEQSEPTDDLDDYAAWAAEAAKRAEEKPAAVTPHKPFPKIPMGLTGKKESKAE